VSNAAIGFFRPLPLDDSHLIVLRYSATGFVPTVIDIRPTEDLSAVTFLGEQVAEKHPEVTTWTAAPTSSVDYQPQVLRQGPYRRTDLSLESVFPIIQGFQDAVALGASARFSDPLGLDTVKLDLSYSPGDALPSWERLHFSADAHHGEWSTGVAWNGADFYDLFGPIKRSVTGYNGYVGYEHFLVFEPPETLVVKAKVEYYGDLQSLPGFQNVPSPSSNLFTAEASVAGVDTRRSPGAVDAEAGYTWSLKAHLYSAAGEAIPSIGGTYNVGFPLPLDHSSIWLRTGSHSPCLVSTSTRSQASHC